MKLHATMLALAFASSAAFATQTETVTVGVSAKINTEEFQVSVPDANDNWIADGVTLTRAATSADLSRVTKQLYLKSTTGAVSARLLSAPMLTSGGNSINLGVAINAVTLGTTAAEVLVATSAANGQTVPVEITADAAPVAGYVPGDYTGTISMIFETPAP